LKELLSMIPLFRKLAYITLILILAASCASVKPVILDPEVSVTEVRVTELSFYEISLEMELLITNPNPLGIDLEGFDYDFLINDASFIRGNQEDKVSLAAHGKSSLVIPFTLNYQNMYQTMVSIRDSRESDYKIVTGLHFVLPVLGEQRLELAHEGQIPLIRLPRFSFESLYVSSLGLMGADIIILMKVQNPNSFDINLKEFQGVLKVNKQKWAELDVPETVFFPSEEWRDMGFQIRLEFLSMGRTVRDLLSGEEALFYDYQGQTLLESSLEGLKDAYLPLDVSGEIELIKPASTIEGQHSSQKIEDTIEGNLLNIFGAYSR
jgi:LEA14-like dessication related protein